MVVQHILGDTALRRLSLLSLTGNMGRGLRNEKV